MQKKLIYLLLFIPILFLIYFLIMPDEKVYTPAVLEDTPFPQEEDANITVSQSKAGGTYSPQTTKDQQFPKKVVAQEIISNVLNTKSKKILGEFELVDQGAFKVGKYVDGVSGEVTITPNGITARDSNGETTFSLDGDTGDATFKGTLQAGTVVAGDNTVIVDEDNGHGRLLFMDGDKVAILLGWGDF